MKTLFKMKPYTLVVLVLGALMALGSCEEDQISGTVLDSNQLSAGRIDGTWVNPSNIVTPGNVPTEVFGNMRLVFTTDAQGYPSQFLASGCPIIFSSATSTWSFSSPDSQEIIALTDVYPVDEMNVVASSTSLTMSFYMGWENTDTGEVGEGDFSVTLSRN